MGGDWLEGNDVGTISATGVTDWWGVFPEACSLGNTEHTDCASIYIQAGVSHVVCFPTNAAGGTLVAGAQSPFHNSGSDVDETSFRLSTAGGSAAAGTETFACVVTNDSDLP
jgi:hypothetical protein